MIVTGLLLSIATVSKNNLPHTKNYGRLITVMFIEMMFESLDVKYVLH